MPTDHKADAAFLQAIAEPNRIAIIKSLAQGSKNVTELAKELNVEIVNVSHHLGVLRTNGLVKDEKHGRFVVYDLVDATVKANVLFLKRGETTVELSL